MNIGLIFRMHLNGRDRLFALLAHALVGLWLVPMVNATTVIPPAFEELVNESDYIVHATVKAVASEWREDHGRRFIVTKVDLEILEVINGVPPSILTLEMLGGQVGNEVMVVEGFPAFQAGQEDILFVRGNGKQICPLFAVMHGRYPIHRGKDGHAHVLRGNRTPLRGTNEVSLPMESGREAGLPQWTSLDEAAALSPENFVRQIQAAVNINYHRKS